METGLPRRLAELGDVRACDEGAAGADDHDRADAVVGQRLLQTVGEALAHVLAQRIHGRVVDSDHGHAAATLEVHGLGDGGHGAPRWVSLGWSGGAYDTPPSHRGEHTAPRPWQRAISVGRLSISPLWTRRASS